MEIRALTIAFAKNKTKKKQKRNEEKDLLMEFNQLQQEIRSNFGEDTKIKMDRLKKKLAKIVAKKCKVR